MFSKVNANVIFVQDLDKMMRFYRDVLGLEVVFSDATSHAFKMDGQDFALVTVPSAVDMLNEEVLGVGQKVVHRYMLCVDVDDVDSVYKTLSEKGATFIKPPTDQYWGFRTAYFTDPEGTIWELRQGMPAKQ